MDDVESKQIDDVDLDVDNLESNEASDIAKEKDTDPITLAGDDSLADIDLVDAEDEKAVMCDEDSVIDSPLLHVMVVGFHHQKGSQVEFIHPPLPSSNGAPLQLPAKWTNLPFLALPDGSHNYDKGSVYFHLEDLNEKQTVFGVSCFLQVDSKDFKKTDDEVTRSTVQKSVCVLLKQPLYGFVASKLEAVVHAYFAEMDFTKTDIIVQFYDSLNHSLLTSHFTDAVFHIGLEVSDLTKTLKDKLLMLMKVILLEKKVVIYDSSASVVSSTILSLMSLFPGILQKGLIYSAVAQPSKESADLNETISSPTDQFGFPLRLCDKDCVVHPYHSLQQMNLLKNTELKSFVVGVSNMLYLQYQHCPADIIYNVLDNEILIRDTELSSAVALTTEDLRFVDFIVTTISEHNTDELHTEWEGGDDWIRFHFKAYLLCLCSTSSQEDNQGATSAFNSRFIDAWKQTNNYLTWLNTERPGLDEFPHGHPFHGEMSVSDVRLRLQSIAETVLAYSGQGRKLGEAVKKTGEIVGTVYNSAKWTLSSFRGWVSGVVEEIDHEMKSEAVEIKGSPEELDSGMSISARERLGVES